MDQTALNTLYKKYGKETVDKAVEFLLYKNPSPMPKTEVSGKPTIYIFRHGESEDNKNFVFSGWRDAQLTENGMLQALKIAPTNKKQKNRHVNFITSNKSTRYHENCYLSSPNRSHS